MNKTNIKNIIRKFIVRRAFRHGSVSRADLMEAFSFPSANATRIMTENAERLRHLLERKGHNLIPKPLAQCPDYANEADLLHHLNIHKCEPTDTGLFENELPLIYVSWTNSLPSKPGTLQTIISAIDQHKQIDIIYVGLRLNEEPRRRKILPLALEKMNDQWRVVAQDLDAENFPVKVFVLPRIMSASFSTRTVRTPYSKGYTDGHINLNVELDERFTVIQKEMLTNELNIDKNNKVKIATRSEHEFKRRFTNTPASKDAVWPPLILKEN